MVNQHSDADFIGCVDYRKSTFRYIFITSRTKLFYGEVLSEL